jgi:hypothetical protein
MSLGDDMLNEIRVPPSESEAVKALLQKASAYDEMKIGLDNSLDRFGYYISGRYGRWFVTKSDGLYLHPKDGYHSLEDALVAIIEDIKAQA